MRPFLRSSGRAGRASSLGRVPALAARPADHEPRVEDHAPRRAARRAELVHEEAGELTPHLLDRLTDAGERRLGGHRERRVVEPHDGNVVRDAPTRGAERGKRAERHEIGRDEDRVEVWIPVEETLHGGPTAVVAEVRDLDEPLTDVEAGGDAFVAEPGEAVRARSHVPWSGD